MNRIKTKACLEVTLEQARKWYESGNKDLKKLALTAFSEEMLIPSFLEVLESEKWTVSALPKSASEQLASLALLQLTANYLNKGWSKTEGNTGYFLGKGSSFIWKDGNRYKRSIRWYASKCKISRCLFIFRTVADVQKAVKILGNKLLPLFE